MTAFTLRCHLSPGDIAVLSTTVRDLHASYPGRFTTHMDTSCPAVFEQSPLVSDEPGELIQMEMPLIKTSNTNGLHMQHGFRMWLEKRLGLAIPSGPLRPDLYLSDEEKHAPEPFVRDGRPVWLLNAGSKSDYTIKQWSHTRFQQVIESLPQIHFVQVGQMNHEHPRFNGVTDLIGRTSLRELIVLASKCDGALTGNSALMHLAAAFVKPGVVISGGREPASWCQYENQTFLHTIGQLDCCRFGACWKWRIYPRHDGMTGPDGESLDRADKLCLQPMEGEHFQPQATCMALITVDTVAKAIIGYL